VEPIRRLEPTQVTRPWRATVRTVFQAIVAFAAMWGLMVPALGLDAGHPWVVASIAATGAMTRVMALPSVEEWLERFVPWLAASPAGER
jgi:hypothetical protein